MANQSYQQDQALQSQDNANVAKYTNQYDTANQNANQAQSDLQNFTKNMRSGTDFYQQGVNQGNINSGYDVNQLNQGQNQVSQLTSILGNLPRAVQGQNANYGATAGQIAGQLSTEGNSLGNSLGMANQNVANQLQKQNAGLTYGQGYAGAGLQGQQNQLTGYQGAASNAVAIANQAQQAMNSWATIAQNQGGLTASQQNAYAQSKAAYASAAQAMAQVGLIQSQTAGSNLSNQQTQMSIDRTKAAGGNNPNAQTANFDSSPAASMARSQADAAASDQSNREAFSGNQALNSGFMGAVGQPLQSAAKSLFSFFGAGH